MGHYYSEMYDPPQISKEELKKRERIKKAKIKLAEFLGLKSEDELRELVQEIKKGY